MRMRGARVARFTFRGSVPPVRERPACTGKIDLIICMDASGSIGFQDHITVQNFAQDPTEFSSSGKSFNGDEGLKVGVFMSPVQRRSPPTLTSPQTIRCAGRPEKEKEIWGHLPEDCFDDARASFKSALAAPAPTLRNWSCSSRTAS